MPPEPNERTRWRSRERGFESEPSDEWQDAYGRGGPVRSDDPERDYFFEHAAAPARSRPMEPPEQRRMAWRAEGAQDYPGGELEEQLTPNHRGKGPKGYRPSDERVKERVCERLTDDPYIDASDIEVSVANGEVALSGTVLTRRMKHRVEDLVAEIPGVTAIDNGIRAAHSGSNSGSGL